jgi:hypothetical protein
MAEKTLKTIIVLRNDQTTAWEESSYVLKKGELGVGYLADGKVIVKVGNDEKTWKELPQVEGVFEDNLTLTYAFGKYAPGSAGSYTLNTAGKTMSEVMLDAFAQEVYTDLITSSPSASFSAVNGSTSGEVGNTHLSPKVKLDLTISGSYKYGAKDSAGKAATPNIAATKAEIQYNNTVVKQMDSANPNADLTYDLGLTGDALKYVDGTDTYKFYGYAESGADTNRPLTNLGNFIGKDSDGNYFGTKNFEQATGQIAAKSLLNAKEVKIEFTGYRKMFMGTSKVAAPTIDSDFIRSLSTVSAKAEKTSKEVNASAGDKAIYWAWPTSLTTAEPTFQYYFMGAWQSLAGPVKVADNIAVEGANGYNAVNYTVYKYSPKSGEFDGAMQTKIKIN